MGTIVADCDVNPVTIPAAWDQAARRRSRYCFAEGFAGSPLGKTPAEGDHTMMLIFVLLVPMGLLGLLLGMERLERWTVGQEDDSSR
jgi:hypothetical protein